MSISAITRTRVKVGETETTETGKVCNTTEAAEIFFVIDASSSIRDYNYVKVLDFAAKVTESFKVSNENVSSFLSIGPKQKLSGTFLVFQACR